MTFKLVDIVSKGGNYLLNVGPMADGVIPQPSQDTLRTVGRWLKVNGEAVYGAGPTPFGEELGEPSCTGRRTCAATRSSWRATSTVSPRSRAGSTSPSSGSRACRWRFPR